MDNKEFIKGYAIMETALTTDVVEETAIMDYISSGGDYASHVAEEFYDYDDAEAEFFANYSKATVEVNVDTPTKSDVTFWELVKISVIDGKEEWEVKETSDIP